MSEKEKINKITIIPGCVSCGSCVSLAPEIFEMKNIATVKPNAPIEGNEEKIIEAAAMCPVEAIELEKS